MTPPSARSCSSSAPPPQRLRAPTPHQDEAAWTTYRRSGKAVPPWTGCRRKRGPPRPCNGKPRIRAARSGGTGPETTCGSSGRRRRRWRHTGGAATRGRRCGTSTRRRPASRPRTEATLPCDGNIIIYYFDKFHTLIYHINLASQSMSESMDTSPEKTHTHGASPSIQLHLLPFVHSNGRSTRPHTHTRPRGTESRTHARCDVHPPLAVILRTLSQWLSRSPCMRLYTRESLPRKGRKTAHPRCSRSSLVVCRVSRTPGHSHYRYEALAL